MIKACVVCGCNFEPSKRTEKYAVCCSQRCSLKKWRREHPEHNRKLKMNRRRRFGVLEQGSIEHRNKMSLIQLSKNIGGDRHPNWKGGYQNHLMHTKIRLATQKANGGSFSIDEWNELVALTGHVCMACGSNDTLTIDHIIPVTKGGDSYITNIQPLCRRCNSSKKDKIINYMICQL